MADVMGNSNRKHGRKEKKHIKNQMDAVNCEEKRVTKNCKKGGGATTRKSREDE